jgi:hypothetical protein
MEMAFKHGDGARPRKQAVFEYVIAMQFEDET